MQEGFENLCFIAVLMKKQKFVCSHDAETVIHDWSFFMDFVFASGEET